MKSATRPFIRKWVNGQKICVRWIKWNAKPLNRIRIGCGYGWVSFELTRGLERNKSGLCFRDFPQLGPNGISRARPESIRYTASRKNAVQFGKDLYALATNSGIYQEDIMKSRELCLLVMVLRGYGTWQMNTSPMLFRF